MDISKQGKGALPEDIIFQANNHVSFGDILLPRKFSLRDKTNQYKRKNQGSSLACGGGATSNYARLLTLLRNNAVLDLSSKFIYSQVFVSPGGSRASDIIPLVTTKGAATEVDVPSMLSDGSAPNEPFMEDKSQITPEIYQKALQQLFKNARTFISNDINEVKKAIFTGNGAVLAVLGKDEDWVHPGGLITVPMRIGSFWGHFIFIMGWDDDKQLIEFENDWSEQWGDAGYGWLPYNYLTQNFGYNEFTLIEAPIVPPQTFNHAFYTDMHYGEVDPEVIWLQLGLQKLGFFPADRLPSQYYLNITRAAVEKFQKANGVWNPLIFWYDQSHYVGPKTRTALNKLLSN